MVILLLMKKVFLLFCILYAGVHLWAQDSVQVKKTEEPRHLKTWHISGKIAMPDSIPVDTTFLNFQDQNLIDKYSIANSYNGNLGSPMQSKLYFNRPQGSDFLFDDAYTPYILDIKNATFYDVKFPYSNLTYLNGGPAGRKEQNIKFLFTASPSKIANFGTYLDYFYSVGSYANQAARRFTGSVFGQYEGKHYSAYGFAVLNNIQNHENGGLSNFSLSDSLGTKPQDWITNLDGYSAFTKNQVYYNHKYSIGFYRKVKITEDSTSVEYVPVTHFGHTIKYEETQKRYYEPKVDTSFYDNTYIRKTGVWNDTAAIRTLSNTFYINMDEKFNKLMKFGLTAYIENEINQFIYLEDSTLTRTMKSSTMLGGVLSKNEGNNFRYNLSGNICLLGYKLGEFNLEGKAIGNFRLLNQDISLSAFASIRNEQPSFFLQYYSSNHFKWENNFSKIYRTSIGGLFSMPKTQTWLKLNIENATDLIYFSANALPEQYQGNVQIISADLKQNLHFANFVLENNVVYQLSSNNDVVPLPTFSLYHNLYYLGTWFNVLTAQIGAEMRLQSKYYAPAYMPATGQFYSQKNTLIGGYPIVNAYMNYHLKFARFFLEYYHINRWFMKGNYFSMPDYPLNPTIFKMGLSWNFFN